MLVARISSKASAAPPLAVRWTDVLCILVGAAVLWALWYSKFSSAGLWYDELQSVTLAGRSLPAAIFSVIVYDPHPPLYYVFLHFWMSAFGSSDCWILVGSLFLTMLTGVAINVHCRKYFDRATAMIATIFFLIHPYALYWSGQARMYAAVTLFAVLFQQANARYFLDEEKAFKRRRLLWVVISGATLSCLHNCGILFSGTVALYWLLRQGTSAVQGTGTVRRSLLKPWLLAQGCVVLISAPFVVHSMVEHLGHAERPSLGALVTALASMSIGPERAPHELIIAGALATTIVLVAAARSAELRLQAGILVLFPMLSFWLISNLLKPIWVADRLFAFLVPFFCILGARVLRRGWEASRTLRPTQGRTAAVTLGMVLLATVIAGDRQILAAYSKPNDWRGAAALVRSYAPDGGTVEVDQLRDRWSLNWYLLGPGWDEGIQQAMLQAMHQPARGGKIERLVAIRTAMERYETERSRGKYVVEAGLTEHHEPNGAVMVFTEHCPASEFWSLYLRDPKREPQPGFLATYQPLPPLKGLCGYVSPRTAGPG